MAENRRHFKGFYNFYFTKPSLPLKLESLIVEKLHTSSETTFIYKEAEI